MTDHDKMLLNITRTGSQWTKNTAYWAGHDETQMCRLCNKSKETAEHINWHCEVLNAARIKADKGLATCNKAHMHTAVLHGIAPAMTADPRLPFWGTKPEATHDVTQYTKEECKMFGCFLGTLPVDCRRVIEATSGECTARALVQIYTGQEPQLWLCVALMILGFTIVWLVHSRWGKTPRA